MKRFLLFIALVLVVSTQVVSAQVIPGRYIVEFNTPPAAALMTPRTRLTPGTDPQIAARKAQIAAERVGTELRIRALGGTVTHRYDTLINGIAVTLSDSAAAELAQMPNVRGVYPVTRHRALLDHAAKVHRITDAVQSLANGMADAGKGIKIGMLDTGIDVTHPAFQGFSTPIPDGYPKVSAETEMANTNNKIIVARVYLSMQGATDMVGHGTGTSAIAAGLTADPATAGVKGVPPITGVAPAAWLGNYNVFDDDGFTDSATFQMALQDALNDGMNVVNYSVGGPIVSANLNNSAEARAINAAVAAGMLVVAAAGNEGEYVNLDAGVIERYPGGGTINEPAALPSVIGVGSNPNDRTLGFAVAADTAVYPALVPDSQLTLGGQITGVMALVSTLDTDGLGCAALPSKSLEGKIAVIKRGTCNFSVKLDNAQAAGAAAAIVYDHTDEALFSMSVADATLPATMISRASGADLLARLAANSTLQGLADFNGTYPLPQSADRVSSFSSTGPTPGGALKPDLVATGDPVITADTTVFEQFGEYPPYMVLDGFGGSGTSFSAPFVTGSIAVLMGARPGLTAAQYRSLVSNSAAVLKNGDGVALAPQTAGSGRLDLFAAIKNPLAAVPSTLTFSVPATTGVTSGAGSEAGAANTKTLTQNLAITNIGSAGDTFTVAVTPINTDGTIPSVDTPTFTLNPGESKTLILTLADSGLPTGEYHGFVTITGTGAGGVVTRIPYWYGVPGTSVKYITLLSPDDPSGGSTGDEPNFYIRLVDEIGMPITGDAPTVTGTGSRTRILSVDPVGGISGTFQISVRLGRADELGLNVFTVKVGDVTRTITVFIQ